MAKEKNMIQQVKLKDGKVMNYMKSHDGRHIFLGDVRIMSVWMMALVIFILITTILIGFYQITLMEEIGNRMLQQISLVGSACGMTAGYIPLVTMPTGSNDGS